MEGFTLVDAVVAGVIVLSAILAYSRGLVREGMAILGWILAAIVARMFAAPVQPLVKELPVVGDFLADSCELSIIAAFAAVFAVALIIASLFTPLLSSAIHRTALGGLDQGLGFQITRQEIFPMCQQITAHAGGRFGEQCVHGLDITLHQQYPAHVFFGTGGLALGDVDQHQ